MLFNKSIKKFILLSLLVALPAQTMTMPSWFSFSSIKENIGKLVSAVSFASIKTTFKRNKTATLVVGGCVATCLAVLFYKKKKAAERKKEKEAREDAKLDAALAERARIAREDAELDAALAERDRIAEEKKVLGKFKAKRDAKIEEESRIKKEKEAREDAKLDAALAERARIAQEIEERLADADEKIAEENRRLDERLAQEREEQRRMEEERHQREEAERARLAAQARLAREAQAQEREEEARLEQEEKESKEAAEENQLANSLLGNSLLGNTPSIDEHYFASVIKDKSVIDPNNFTLEDFGKKEYTVEDDQFELIPEKYQNYEIVRNLVKKNGCKSKERILLACVHGTFSSEASFGGDETRQTTQGIIKFAQKLAHTFNCSVEIISFKWSGELDQEHRKEAGSMLAQIIKDEVEKGGIQAIWSIAHSFGCAVVNHAAQELQGTRRIDVGVQMAPPITDDISSVSKQDNLDQLSPKDEAFNFKKLYVFYSTDDATAMLGSLSRINGYKWINNGRKWPVRISNDSQVYNVRLQANGQGADHVNIKLFCMLSLPELIANIDAYYPYHYDLDANIFLNDIEGKAIAMTDEMPLVAIRNENICYTTESLKVPDEIDNYLFRSLTHSNAVKNQFKEKYNRDIKDKLVGVLDYCYLRPLRVLWNEVWTALIAKENKY